MSKSILITSNMTPEQLAEIKKLHGKNAKTFQVKVVGEHYYDKRYPIKDWEYMQGVTGEVVFQK